MAQHKVFEDKLAFATSERSTAGAARDLRLSRLRSRFDLDHVVERLAVRTRKGNKRGGLPPAILRPPTPNLIVTRYATAISEPRHATAAKQQWPLASGAGAALPVLRHALVRRPHLRRQRCLADLRALRRRPKRSGRTVRVFDDSFFRMTAPQLTASRLPQRRCETRRTCSRRCSPCPWRPDRATP